VREVAGEERELDGLLPCREDELAWSEAVGECGTRKCDPYGASAIHERAQRRQHISLNILMNI